MIIVQLFRVRINIRLNLVGAFVTLSALLMGDSPSQKQSLQKLAAT